MKSCRIQMDFAINVESNLRQHQWNNTKIKAAVIKYIDWLIQQGFRHFVIYIETPTDLWVAEIIYFLLPCYKEVQICYSLGFWIDETGMEYSWIDNIFRNGNQIVNGAKKIIYRNREWISLNYVLKRLDFCNPLENPI